MSLAESLLRENEDWWGTWLPHPFTRAVAEETVAPEVFNRWLAQDYLFVREGLRFLALLLAKAPSPLVDPLAETMMTWRNELVLFREQAHAAGADLEVELLHATRTYDDFLIATAHRHPFVVGWAVLYAVEKSYHDAWRWVAVHQSPGSRYAPWAENWGSELFAGFTRFLAETLDDLALGAAPRDLELARVQFRHAAQLEYLFWEMAFSEEPAAAS